MFEPFKIARIQQPLADLYPLPLEVQGHKRGENGSGASLAEWIVLGMFWHIPGDSSRDLLIPSSEVPFPPLKGLRADHHPEKVTSRYQKKSDIVDTQITAWKVCFVCQLELHSLEPIPQTQWSRNLTKVLCICYLSNSNDDIMLEVFTFLVQTYLYIGL